MSINFIDAAGVLADSAQLLLDDKMAHEAREVVRDVVAAYDTLEPKPEEWPDGYNFYAVDTDGEGGWYTHEPAFDFDSGYWRNTLGDWKFDRAHDIGGIISVISPLMLCWQRPEAQP